MSRLIPNLTKLLSVGLLVAAVGCNDQTSKMNEQEQAAQAAADQIKDLQDQLSQAIQDRIAAEDQAAGLRLANERLQKQLAERPEPTPSGWDAVPGGAMTAIEGTVLFDSGKAVLKPTCKNTLDEVAQVIRERFAGHDIYIFGHTDDEPIKVSGWTDNYELSCQRALSVLRYLRDQGVLQDMSAGGWGEDRPVADNTTAADRQSNRRVEIFAMAREQPIARATPS